jgi:hypothetical protein
MSGYDKWIMSSADDGLDEQDRIDQEISRLMKLDYDPDNFNNFVEAITEDCLAPHKDTIEQALITDDKALLGLLISSAVFTYWEKKAINDAQDQESAGLL